MDFDTSAIAFDVFVWDVISTAALIVDFSSDASRPDWTDLPINELTRLMIGPNVTVGVLWEGMRPDGS
jgi:hypothetical protein